MISAFVMMNVQGNFGVCKSGSTLNHDVQKDTLKKTPLQRMRTKMLQALRPVKLFYAFMKDILFYLYSCGFGLLILMKASGTLTWASADVLNAVSLAIIRSAVFHMFHNKLIIFSHRSDFNNSLSLK